ncbi:MAG: L-threonylcarbamoyladenylate synthase [Deltaproteobacteria bacterium]|nr:L-threonylcarbamoyladenylate synthase [Deltaproteobacteria bacterium]
MTELLTIDPANFSLSDLQPAVKTLLDGGIVAAATESFYGLMVIADRPAALENLFLLKFGHKPDYSFTKKEKPKTDNAFLLLLDTRERVMAYAQDIPKEAAILMDRFWPGLLTIIFKAQSGLHPAILGKKQSSIALRVDRFPVPGALARMTDRGITGTSANPHGEKAATSAREVLEYFPGLLDMVVDTGPSFQRLADKPKPSTIIDMTKAPFHIIRDGAINGKDVMKTLSFPEK